ncbi:ADP-ribosylglycohydrolase [Streptomyces sp. DI166]|uniref:ADP-ribosylglycohydrolase family protein n=1 Tax=Streptomyces sp. DI166 TaxID=1839783 RepID=UPI0007F4676B|nr:ADP-ribosylglycohydrolase family protein [Streptomyces sp. DI166]SBT89320.1 ADP-ribosylglycohydrolase [Streptomyces sp. DI166]
MTSTSNTMAKTARGIFLGAAVGDALGWPQEVRGGLVGGQKERDRATPRPEFQNWTRYAGHYSKRYRDPVHAGEYSDDTQLLLAVARSCLAGERWWERLTEVELPTWPSYQRGGGGAVLAAAASWADGRPPWRNDGPSRAQAVEKRYRNAGANGVAMRIAPHVLWAETSDDLIRRIVLDGITTHGHPRALVGALVYAFALRDAASSQTTHGFGDSVEAAAAGLVDVERVLRVLPTGWGTAHDLERFAVTWQDTNKETSQLLELIADSLHRGAMSNPEITLERLGCTDPKINGAGTVSAAAAIYLASRFAARPQGGLLTAAFLRKGDTDTLASLTAAILGALHDTNWLGNLAAEVQDANYIARLADRSAAHAADPPKWPTRRPMALRRALNDALLPRRAFHSEFPDGRQCHVDDFAVLHDGRVLRARLFLDDGQTAFIDLPTDPTTRSGETSREHSSRQRQPTSGQSNGASEPVGTSSRSATHTPMAPHSVARHSTQPETDAVLATLSLARSAAFYAQLTGRDIPVRAGTVEISPGLLLRQSATGTLIDAASVIVHITVDDLAEATRRLGIESTVTSGVSATFEVRDPDGRTVRVGQRPAK